MRRRNFVTAASAALSVAASDAAAQTAARNQYFLLRCYYMRSGAQVDRTTKFLGSAYLPAAKRAGAKTLGFFSPVIGERSPFILALAVYPSISALETSEAHVAADKDFQTAADAYDIIGDPAYIRIETELLRAFDGIPELTAPPNDGKRAARIFEMRTYESPSEKAGRRKIKMFEDGEAGIFRRLGMEPVFFGQGAIGAHLPSLSYMLSYDDLASRDRLWKAFGADPEWQKLRAQPGLSDAEIVSNIDNRILRPLSFSEIR
ncbi:MAG: NIPSNAP family protein [Bryobacteraceae bacterium]